MSEREMKTLTALLDQEKPFMRGQAIGLARKEEDAEDLYQDTIMKVFRGFGTFRPDTNFRAWVGRIMLNTHINNYNRKKLATDIACDMSSGECDSTVYHVVDDAEKTSISESPERQFFSSHIDDGVLRAVYSLQKAYKRPFLLFHLEGFSYEEISEMLDVPIGTVKSRIFRARRMLREKLVSFH